MNEFLNNFEFSNISRIYLKSRKLTNLNNFDLIELQNARHKKRRKLKFHKSNF